MMNGNRFRQLHKLQSVYQKVMDEFNWIIKPKAGIHYLSHAIQARACVAQHRPGAVFGGLPQGLLKFPGFCVGLLKEPFAFKGRSATAFSDLIMASI
jgi:hypothetical protein